MRWSFFTESPCVVGMRFPILKPCLPVLGDSTVVLKRDALFKNSYGDVGIGL